MRAIIIDDESHCVAYLEAVLARYCPEVELLASFTDPRLALADLVKTPIDLLFLDIEMPGMNGFDLLAHFAPAPDFSVVFTTAYDQYAIRAFKFGAIDYLLKPIQRQELTETISRIRQQQSRLLPAQLEFARQLPANPGQLALSTAEGLHIVEISEILYCESDGCYTRFHLQNQGSVLLSKPIKEATELLESNGFLRIHHSYLVNVKAIRKYLRGDGGELVMSNGANIPVSRSKKHLVAELFWKL